MIFVGKDGQGRTTATDIASSNRLLGNENDADDMVFLTLWMRLASHFYIQQAVAMGKLDLMILIGFFLYGKQLHFLVAARQAVSPVVYELHE